MKSVTYGLVGCGMMGHEHLHNIALLPDVRVGAVYDPVPAQAQSAAKMARGARIAESFADLVEDPSLDALVVVSPNHLHLAQLEEIGRRRPVPLLMEKPLFTDPDDAARLAQVAADYAAPVWVAMEYRYMPPVAALIEQAAAATGGVQMLTIREHRFPFLDKIGNWNRFNANSGGTFVEKCCHFFDLMRLILRSDPVRIMATAGQAANHLDERYNGAVPDILDHGYVLVDFASGARACLELCMFAEGARYQEEISAVGAKGKIECFVPGPGRFWPEMLGPAPVPELVISPRSPKGPLRMEMPVEPALLAAGDHNGSTYYQHKKFNAVVRGEADVEVTIFDGEWAVRMGHAAQRSARTGQAVVL